MNLNLHYSAFIMTHLILPRRFRNVISRKIQTNCRDSKGEEKKQIKEVKHAREDWELLRCLFSK